MADSLSSFKTDHHFAAGLFLVGAGLLGIAGSVTGRLFSMIAALFCPSALQSAA